MKLHHAIPVLVALAGACADPVAGNPGSGATIHFVSAAHGSVTLMVDGQAAATNVPLGGSVQASIAPGTHSIVIQKLGGGASYAQSTTVSAGGSAVIIALDSSGAARASVLLDTNAVVPAGATKLRVAHYATNAPTIDIWRTQPDYLAPPIRVQFPFNVNVVSPYLQSTIGDWRVMVSHAIAGCCGPMPDTLANSGVIAIGDGKSRTVVITDGATAGTVQVVVVEP